MTEFKFLKAHGLGNDFVIFTEHSKLNISKKLVKFLSDRKKGVGCDLTVFLNKSENNYSDLVARFFNKDGSEAEVCGNALRCIGNYYFKKFNKKNVTVETNSGLIDIEKNISEKISVDLGKPNISWDKIPIKIDVDTQNLDFDFDYLKGGFAVNVGNPHVIFFVDNNENFEIEKIGPTIETHSLFPEKCNVTLATVVNKELIKVRVWERGAGLTKACGTAACATAFAAKQNGLVNHKVDIEFSTGRLTISIDENNSIHMKGPVSDIEEINFKI